MLWSVVCRPPLPEADGLPPTISEGPTQLTFLGTGAGFPSRWRNVSSLALRLPRRGEIWLFDCGEGTQHQLLHSELRTSQISRIFITHLHGDHVYGLLGLLATLSLSGARPRVDVYGPPGLDDFLRAGLQYSHTHLAYRLEIHTVEAGLVFEDPEFSVRCRPLEHRVPTSGYRVDEHDRPGAFDAAAAATLGIPAGPLYGRLKRGERISLPDGRQIDGAKLSGPPEPGRSLAYCTDTTYCASAVELARGVDLLIHEATYAERDAGLAEQRLHATASMAARVARQAGARRLVLTHLSPRYAPDSPLQPDHLLAEARAIFPPTELAADFLSLEIPRHRPRVGSQPAAQHRRQAR